MARNSLNSHKYKDYGRIWNSHRNLIEESIGLTIAPAWILNDVETISKTKTTESTKSIITLNFKSIKTPVAATVTVVATMVVQSTPAVSPSRVFCLSLPSI